MFRRAALVLALCLLILPAAAEARDMGRYSVEPPPGWKVDRGDLLDLFTSPDEFIVIYLVRDKHEGDFSELIEMWTDDEDAAHRLIEPGRSFIYEKRGLKRERGWVGRADDGNYVLLSVEGGHFAGLNTFIARLKADPGEPSLDRIFKSLAALPLVIDWLNYASPSLFKMAPLK